MGVIATAPGDTRAAYDSVASLYLPVALAVTAIVFLAIAFAVVRYRARPGRAPTPTREHRLLEAGIATAIAVVVAVLVVTSFGSELSFAPAATRPTLRVDVTAFRWGWRFSYPGQGGAVSESTERHPAILRVPEGARVRFTLRARDVIHSFWIPELRFKRDAFPGRRQVFDLLFPRRATFMAGHCAVFCGLKHSDMGFSVTVLPRSAFAAWVARARGSGA